MTDDHEEEVHRQADQDIVAFCHALESANHSTSEFTDLLDCLASKQQHSRTSVDSIQQHLDECTPRARRYSQPEGDSEFLARQLRRQIEANKQLAERNRILESTREEAADEVELLEVDLVVLSSRFADLAITSERLHAQVFELQDENEALQLQLRRSQELIKSAGLGGVPIEELEAVKREKHQAEEMLKGMLAQYDTLERGRQQGAAASAAIKGCVVQLAIALRGVLRENTSEGVAIAAEMARLRTQLRSAQRSDSSKFGQPSSKERAMQLRRLRAAEDECEMELSSCNSPPSLNPRSHTTRQSPSDTFSPPTPRVPSQVNPIPTGSTQKIKVSEPSGQNGKAAVPKLKVSEPSGNVAWSEVSKPKHTNRVTIPKLKLPTNDSKTTLVGDAVTLSGWVKGEVGTREAEVSSAKNLASSRAQYLASPRAKTPRTARTPRRKDNNSTALATPRDKGSFGEMLTMELLPVALAQSQSTCLCSDTIKLPGDSRGTTQLGVSVWEQSQGLVLAVTQPNVNASSNGQGVPGHALMLAHPTWDGLLSTLRRCAGKSEKACSFRFGKPQSFNVDHNMVSTTITKVERGMSRTGVFISVPRKGWDKFADVVEAMITIAQETL